jgi:hypothetical protein
MARHPTTVYIDEEIHRVLKLRAADGGSTISDTVNFVLSCWLAKEAEEQQILEQRRGEVRKGNTIPYEEAVRRLKRDGLL